MTADLALAILLGLVLFAAGWFASLRFGRPPTPPTLHNVKALFDAFENNTTRVVTGLQQDIYNFGEKLDSISRWAPGQELENPAQLTRFMQESNTDRKKIHARLDRLYRFVAAVGVGVAFIVGRILYNITNGGG